MIKLVRTKQIFPYHAYSKVVEAILEGQKSPSELLRLKVLSKSKLHRYLNLFTEKGFLIRERLPKRGNYVLYHLHPENFQIPLLIKGNIETAKWTRKKKIRWYKKKGKWKHKRVEKAELLKELYEKMAKLVKLLITEYRDYLKNYRLFFELAPHDPVGTLDLIEQIENQIRCPECAKRTSLQEYLTKGINAIPFLRHLTHEVYCPVCHYSEPIYE